MTLHQYQPTGVATSGTAWSGNTIKVAESRCQHIFVKAASNDTTFDLTVTDYKSRDVRKYTAVTQTVNDLTPWPTKGIYTISISSASADETFEVYLCFVE